MAYFPKPPSRSERFKDMLPDIIIGIFEGVIFFSFLLGMIGMIIVMAAAMDKL